MKGKDILRDLVGSGRPATDAGPVAVSRPTGAVRALNLGLNRLTEEAAAAKTLREALASSAAVVEIDPADIDASFVNDRLPSVNDPAFDDLRRAIETTGQQVPILVRPHPTLNGRFQSAYGHRRLRAAAELGRKVKAIVRSLSDDEMVIAQGQENGPRLDLSFIERALFAAKMEEHGLSRETICVALSVDKPEVSRLLTVAEAIGQRVVSAIGAAPKVGRPRWLALAQALETPQAVKAVDELISTDVFARADSNERFSLVLAATVGRRLSAKGTRQSIEAAGRRVAWIERKNGSWQLTSKHQDFAGYLDRKLPELLAEFQESFAENAKGWKESQ